MIGHPLQSEAQFNIESPIIDAPQPECGIVVVNTPSLNAGRIACVGISQLFNRGYEATGISAVSHSPDGVPHVEVQKDFGKGSDVFPDGGVSLSILHPAHQASAHSRYSTQGTKERAAAQPHYIEVPTLQGVFHLSHVDNGNLKNTAELAELIGVKPGGYSTDSELKAMVFADTLQKLAASDPNTPVSLSDVVKRTLPRFKGAFTGAVMIEGETVVYSDPHGLKPAVIGRLPDYGLMVASEVTALDANDAALVQELHPGTIMVINADGSKWHTEQWAEPRPKGCLVELLYVMKERGKNGTKARFHDVEVEAARENAGFALASVKPVKADYVCGMPNSAITSGKGYKRGSQNIQIAKGIEYLQFLMANKLDKTFIAPTQEQRAQMVRDKIYVPDTLKIDEEEIQVDIMGKRLIVVDDSLIRGTTMRETVNILKMHKPAEIHLRIALDRVKFICDLGMAMGSTDELLSANLSDEELCMELGVDSIAFLPSGIIETEVLKDHAGEFCNGCLTGEYPTDVPKILHAEVSVTIVRKPELVGAVA